MSTLKKITKSTTAAYKVCAAHNITLSAANYLQNNAWVIGNKHLHLFNTYYLLQWQASYFREQLREGTIKRLGITYQIIYHRTNAADITKAAIEGKDIMLSFRSLLADFNCKPVVLISIKTRPSALPYTNQRN